MRRLLAAAALLLAAWSGAAATLPLARRDSSPYKRYSGLRARQDSVRRVYLHDQTVAVAEMAPGQRLLSCEFIEVYKPGEVADTLANLRNVSQHVVISFEDMTTLMTECDGLGSPLDAPGATDGGAEERGSRAFDALSLLSGIVPGTKWCGVGDLAAHYHDLGSRPSVDRCCRAHDICPAKVRRGDTRYNLTNTGLFTKSHCECDARLYECLKMARQQTADTLGTFYFNIMRVQCVDDVDPSSCRADDCGQTRRFRRLRLRY